MEIARMRHLLPTELSLSFPSRRNTPMTSACPNGLLRSIISSRFRVWYRDALSQYVREMLLDPRTLSRPYVVRRALEDVVERHLRGDRNYTAEIHKVLTLELIHRLFVDAN